MALSLAAGFITWLLIGNPASPSSAPVASSTTVTATTATPVAPVTLSAAGLRAMAKRLAEPIYWAGTKRGYRYELRRTASGDVYVRYLPRGVKAGATGSSYLTIATYPYPDALQALQALGHGKATSVPDGGIALVDSAYPKSVYLAFPQVPYEIEVYDPRPAVSRSIALSGHVRPAG